MLVILPEIHDSKQQSFEGGETGNPPTVVYLEYIVKPSRQLVEAHQRAAQMEEAVEVCGAVERLQDLGLEVSKELDTYQDRHGS
jgi:hypothetical protein